MSIKPTLFLSSANVLMAEKNRTKSWAKHGYKSPAPPPAGLDTDLTNDTSGDVVDDSGQKGSRICLF